MGELEAMETDGFEIAMEKQGLFVEKEAACSHSKEGVGK
jgi:hypothetical protein